MDLTATGCGSGNPCINATFGPTATPPGIPYWSFTIRSGNPFNAWGVDFIDGSLDPSANKGLVIL